MKPKEIISKENLFKLGFTNENHAGGGLTEYCYKHCPLIRICCFMGVWFIKIESIDQYEIAKYAGAKVRYELADFNSSNIKRGVASKPELTSNEEIIEVMLKWIDGAKKYQQHIVEHLQEVFEKTKSMKL